MDRKKDVIAELRQLDMLRTVEGNLALAMEALEDAWDVQMLRRDLRRVQCRVETIENAMQVLDPEERLVADWMFVYPRRGNVQRLCHALQVEKSSVYRKRERLLGKLEEAMFGGG